MAAPFLRGFRLGLVTTRVTRAATAPPLQSENFNRLADLPLAPTPSARRFDVNETANFFNLAAATAAARDIAELTPAAFEAHCRTLLDRLAAGLPAGFEPLAVDAPLRSHILCVRGPDEAATARALAHLRARRIAVSSRESALRVSPHVYNTADDIDRPLDGLRHAVLQRDTPPDPEPDDAVHQRLRLLLGL